MVPIILALVIGATITVPITGWLLSLNQNIGNTDSKLEASTVSMEEWNRLGHMSLDELRAQKETLKEPYPVGDYKVMVNLGEEGYFSDGKCGAVPSGKIANCFNDTTITVFNSDGERQFNSRQLPLQVGIYTKEEIDDLMKKMQADMTKMQAELIKKIESSGGSGFPDFSKPMNIQPSQYHIAPTDVWCATSYYVSSPPSDITSFYAVPKGSRMRGVCYPLKK